MKHAANAGWDQRLLSRAGPPMAACAHGGPALALLAGPTLHYRDRSAFLLTRQRIQPPYPIALFIPGIQQVIIMICQFCGVEAPTKKVSFHQNIGMLVMRMSKSASGNMCKSCVHQTFWRFETINLFLGWWGVISFVINVVIIPWNLIQYLMCLPMEAVPPDAQVPQLTDEVVNRLSPHTENLVAQLNSGETFDRVADNIAMQAGITKGQVALYVQALMAASENNHLGTARSSPPFSAS